MYPTTDRKMYGACKTKKDIARMDRLGVYSLRHEDLSSVIWMTQKDVYEAANISRVKFWRLKSHPNSYDWGGRRLYHPEDVKIWLKKELK